jgi:pimeloyl-ACP methyl ester carboxylesterase
MPVILEGDTDRATAMVQDYYGDLWDGLNDDQRSVLGEREAFAERSASRDVDVYGSDWFRSLLGYDPTSDWARVTVPVLAIFGGKDAQVLAAPNLAALQDALDVAGNDQVETIVIPEANHLFQAAETGAVQEYPTLEPAFVEGLIDAIVAWATQAAGVAQ